MFSTLLGGLPRPPLDASATADDRVDAALASQAEAGLELLSDGGQRWSDDLEVVAGLDDLVVERAAGGEATARLRGLPAWRAPLTVDAWRAATAASPDRPVKQVLPGPFSLAWRLEPTDAAARGRLGPALAEALNAELRVLAEAGCPLVEVHEPALIDVDTDAERAAFGDAARRLLDGVGDLHVSLAIVGGAADRAGAATLADPPFSSYAFDLRRGPDNWRLVAQIPAERGIVVGVVGTEAGSDDGKEILVWAAHYAASTQGRGLERVGLATAGSLAHLPWEIAVAKLAKLGRAARLAAEADPEAIAGQLDPRAVDPRSAAMGRFEGRRRSGRRRPADPPADPPEPPANPPERPDEPPPA